MRMADSSQNSERVIFTKERNETKHKGDESRLWLLITVSNCCGGGGSGLDCSGHMEIFYTF